MLWQSVHTVGWSLYRYDHNGKNGQGVPEGVRNDSRTECATSWKV